MKIYRTDIDGLRAIAIIPVILFHLGYVKNGYLGVDVFFVISGYLITGLVYNEVEENKFSILKFYERRIRRIFPLVLFTTAIAFVLGLLFMLPDDLENLCQSVFASNFSANNILMKITSADYWAVKNDYKPLMHTWSLGVEEQFYMLYPLIFFFLKAEKKRFILPLLLFLTTLSLTAFILSNDISSKFYLLHHRFFELSIGGICALYFSKRNNFINHTKSQYVLYFSLSVLVFLLFFDSINSNDIKVISVTILTAGILALGGLHFESNSFYKSLISNKVLTGIGKISFSIYMWHQIVFAFARYFLIELITLKYAIMLVMIVLLLSVMSYFFIENYFRNRILVKQKTLYSIVCCSFLIITGSSFYVYVVGGIIKDVPELGITKSNHSSDLNFFGIEGNINNKYNVEIRALDKAFSNNNQQNGRQSKKVKVLVVGNSFGRDFANVLKESSFKDAIEVRYSDTVVKSAEEFKTRIKEANFIFFGSDGPTKKSVAKYNINADKLWIVGIKDFGNSNGIHYNKKILNYLRYRTAMKRGVLAKDLKFKKTWDKRYIDLLDLVADSKGQVLVFNPDGKFLSHDTRHLTKFGAIFFAKHLNTKLREIMKL
jgi:peptidoglycan/LPS O-acetylase OafA/YrhL